MSGRPLHSFMAHISGQRANVSIFPDRIQWERAGSQAGAAGKTLGFSRNGPGMSATEVIPVRYITRITSEKGAADTVVGIVVPGKTIDFRVSHNEAKTVKVTLQRLMRAS